MAELSLTDMQSSKNDTDLMSRWLKASGIAADPSQTKAERQYTD
jgi:hypothetical protein